MKSQVFVILLLSTLLTSCYSELYYTQGVYRRLPADAKYGSTKTDSLSNTDSSYLAGYRDGYVEGIDDIFYYKDYAVADWYARHGFYYDFYYNPYYGFYPYGIYSVYLGYRWPRYRWNPYHYYGTGYWVCWDPWDDPYYAYWPPYYPYISISVGYVHYGRHSHATPARYGPRVRSTGRSSGRSSSGSSSRGRSREH